MNKKKLYLIMISVFLVVFAFTGSVAYYRFSYESKISASTGNVVFNVGGIDSTSKSISLGNALKPGDKGSFNVVFDASGSSVDMYTVFEITRGVLPNNLKFYSTNEYKSELHKYFSFLKTSNQSESLTVYWYWDPNGDDEDDNKYINASLSASLSVSSMQLSDYAVIKNGSSSSSDFWNYKSYIRSIDFSNNLSNLPSECNTENLCFDLTDSGSLNNVYGYLVDSGLKDSSNNTKVLYNLFIVSETPIFAPVDSSNYFNGFSNLISIDFNDNFNTTNVTNMSYMFYNCSKLVSLDLGNFNTNGVLNMSYMFNNCSSLVNLDLNGFNTKNVSNMSYMFNGCSSLVNLSIGSFNTSSVTNMSYMFNNCSKLKSYFSVMNNVSTYTNIFSGCSTNSNALFVVDCISSDISIISTCEKMIGTKSSNSKIDRKYENTVKLYSYISKQPNNGVDSDIDFTLEADSSNGEGINILSGTENNTYPIYYYRGDIYNNNIIYAGYCWLIVRTTETGGVKLLYNGVPTNGKCDGSNDSIGTVAFNSSFDSPIYVGYMYGLNAYNSSTLNDYKNHLDDTSIIDTSNTTTETIGNKVFNIAGRHTQNAKSSNVKIMLDTWYQNNIEGTEYESILEDTVWCNDRSISTIKTIDDYSSNAEFWYASRDRLSNDDNTITPNLKCAREIDRFTVNSSNGNGDLEYPIGLLTADEVSFVGSKSLNSGGVVYKEDIFIQRNNEVVWLLSPRYYKSNTAYGIVNSFGGYAGQMLNYDNSVRPSISLKLGTKVSVLGDGTQNNPLVVVN